MNSCLYRCRVMHERLSPKRNRFEYDLFMWSLDLDEIDFWVSRLWLMGHNRWNAFSFWDRDHLPRTGGRVKENVLQFLKEKGISAVIKRVQLVTHLRTFGYLFNPVSFYFCFDAENRPVCAVAEVGNTYGEMKLFVLGHETWTAGAFVDRQTKYFYVSPFLAHDLQFDFRLPVPGQDLKLVINTTQEGKPLLIATLTGEQVALSNKNVLTYAVRFPLIPLQVMALIQWQALKLWCRRLPYWRKAEHPELQREVLHEQRFK